MTTVIENAAYSGAWGFSYALQILLHRAFLCVDSDWILLRTLLSKPWFNKFCARSPAVVQSRWAGFQPLKGSRAEPSRLWTC